MAPAGYSGTPLPKKLGIKDLHVVTLLDAPDGLREILTPLPDGVRFRTDLRAKPDVAVAFFTRRSAFERRIDALGRAVFPAAAAWIAWPKRSSGVETDMTEDVVRAVALPTGLVDVKVCAIDETWSGLKLMWRKELRT
ncbi:MAG: DUF3052 domain-containing protein [Actinomycetota bacterium]